MVGWLKRWYSIDGWYVGVAMRSVVDVPRDTIASMGLNGSARIVAGLSPVKGQIAHSIGHVKRVYCNYGMEAYQN